MSQYKIKSGDTFFSIAQQFNVNLQALQAANPNVDEDSLEVGQSINVPYTGSVAGQEGSPRVKYTVKEGDTLFSIAQHFKVNLQPLQAKNPDIDEDNLSVGQVISIP